MTASSGLVRVDDDDNEDDEEEEAASATTAFITFNKLLASCALPHAILAEATVAGGPCQLLLLLLLVGEVAARGAATMNVG